MGRGHSPVLPFATTSPTESGPERPEPSGPERSRASASGPEPERSGPERPLASTIVTYGAACPRYFARVMTKPHGNDFPVATPHGPDPYPPTQSSGMLRHPPKKPKPWETRPHWTPMSAPAHTPGRYPMRVSSHIRIPLRELPF